MIVMMKYFCCVCNVKLCIGFIFLKSSQNMLSDTLNRTLFLAPFQLTLELFIPVFKKWGREKEMLSIVIFLVTFSDCLVSVFLLNITGAEMNMYFLEELYFEVIKASSLAVFKNLLQCYKGWFPDIEINWRIFTFRK